ncbi:MAG: TRAP transporter small permease [Deltaproteobacteria bacterium]|nr:TRAP transporter small permease [Deltaproteobacteria bacterium]
MPLETTDSSAKAHNHILTQSLMERTEVRGTRAPVTFFDRLINLIEWWSVLLLVLMVLVVILGVFFRYVLNAALVWYDEFASYLLVWLTFYGAVVASYRRRHIGFDLLINRLLPETRRFTEFMAEFLVLGFQIVLFYYGWLLTQKMGDETAVSLVWVKASWIYSVLPITGGLMLVISLRRLAKIVSAKKIRTGDEVAWSGSSSE